MTFKELLAQFRSDVDDTGTPPLWSTASFVLWLNEAENEACGRAELLIDSTTPEIVNVSIAADDPWVTLDYRIVRPLRARATGHNPIQILTAEEMDDTSPNWETDEGTRLHALIRNLESYKLRAYPIQTAAVDVSLTVQRLPLDPLTKDAGDTEPEIPPQYHLKLLPWVKYRAYSVDDVDLQDLDKAQRYYDEFRREFGDRDAHVETFLRRHGGRDMVTGVFV